MEKKIRLLPPVMPNFISVEIPEWSQVEGIKDFKISIADLTDKEAEEYGELMKQQFIAHHHNKYRKCTQCGVVIDESDNCECDGLN